jgi:glyoxylase-like metal-dependent hydrolase (beta-lactamase superfamily II)
MIGGTMRVHALEKDLYVAIGNAFDSNCTILLEDGEAFLIDAMASKTDGNRLKQLIEIELNAKVRFIACTHFFSDHLAALKLFPESEIIAHKNYSHTFDLERFRSEEERSFFVEPTILISDELSIRWGRYHLNLFFNPGHTMSTINIDIPEADHIHVGDTVVGNIAYFAYSSPTMFFRALTRIKHTGRKNLIASHLEPRSSSAVDHAIHYLKALKLRVVERGYKEDDVLRINLQDCLPANVEATPFETIFHKRNLKFIVEQKLFVETS